MIEYIGTRSNQLSELRNPLNHNLTSIINIWMNDRKKDWYAEIGEFIIEMCRNLPRDKKTGAIDFLLRPLTPGQKAVDNFRSTGIMFLTSVLWKDGLIRTFGSPFYHSDFGEGFDDGDDQEDDHQYASYFMKINRHRYHIGYDHRGTSIESENLPPQIILEDVKEVVSKYFQNI